MSTEVKDAEKPQTEQATPAPATETTEATRATAAEVKTETVSKPVEATTESNKQTVAFVKMRQELRELKRKAATATPTPSPAATTEPVAEPPKPVTSAAPAPTKAEVDIEAESVKAIHNLANDPDLAKVPGAVIDLCEMVDTDPRLTRLHDIDPVLAFREAKAIYLSRAGITTPPPVPKPVSVSGGMPPGVQDLQALMAALDNTRPGTKEYSKLVNQINAEMAKRNSA